MGRLAEGISGHARVLSRLPRFWFLCSTRVPPPFAGSPQRRQILVGLQRNGVNRPSRTAPPLEISTFSFCFAVGPNEDPAASQDEVVSVQHRKGGRYLLSAAMTPKLWPIGFEPLIEDPMCHVLRDYSSIRLIYVFRSMNLIHDSLTPGGRFSFVAIASL